MRLAIVLALVACSGTKSSKDGITVELASVTLANDCGDRGYQPPPPPPEPTASANMASKEAARQEVARVEPAAEMPCPPGKQCRSFSGGCAQTSMQLAFRANSTATVTVKKVELLDGMGKYVQDLAPRLPSRWDADRYVVWNEQLEPGKPIAASYALAAPDWRKLGGDDARTKKYHLRVVITVNDSDHTLEKQSISPVVSQPDVVTLR